MNSNLLTVSSSPHLMGRMSLRSMHLEIMIALLPAFLTGMYYFGSAAVWTVVLAMVAALGTEALINIITKQPQQLDDLHAALIGLLMGLILPPAAPWWIPIVGSILAITLGKSVFGGLGNYPMNPVLVAWAAMSISWPEHMAAFLEAIPFSEEERMVVETPLMMLKEDVGMLMEPELSPLYWGAHAGAVGATGAYALILGGLYLIYRRIIAWQIPLGVLVGAAAMLLAATYLDSGIEDLGLEEFGPRLDIMWYHLGVGGMMIAAFFLATESVSSPMTPWGMLLYGLGIGVLAVIIRFWGAYTEGVYYAVLIMSAATPLFDRIQPRVLGKVITGA
jgi:RnfABCDGE-type electron transport complex D subunit